MPTVAVPPGVVTVMVTITVELGVALVVTSIVLPLSEVIEPSPSLPKLTVVLLAVPRFIPVMVTMAAAHVSLSFEFGVYPETVGGGMT